MKSLFRLNKLKVLLILHQFYYVSNHVKLKICSETLVVFNLSIVSTAVSHY